MQALSRILRIELAPPRYLAMPAAGIDISTSGIKIARVVERLHGLELAGFEEYPLKEGAVVGGEIRDPEAVKEGLRALVKTQKVRFANVALPESRGYLFEATVPSGTQEAEEIAVERHLDEYVPLPAGDVVFATAPMTRAGGNSTHVGVGYARRVVEETLSVLDEAGIITKTIESETFALPRALLAPDEKETVLIIDIGKTTTKLLIATDRLPRFVTTLGIGGHALTIAVQKYFGVSEEEAKRVKRERGITSEDGNEEYLAAMMSTVSVIRDEILSRLEYWQARTGEGHEPVSRAILVGGNAAIRGLPEYLEESLRIPVALGDVFRNCASKDRWLPPMPHAASLAYGTVIGLALRDHV